MHVIVCGGRDFAWNSRHDRYLDEVHTTYGLTEVIVGSDDRDDKGRYRGADAHAYDWARRTGINRTLMPANWVGHGRSGGPRRNARMLLYLDLLSDLNKTQALVIAFPGGSGTEDCVRQAEQADVTVLRYPALRVQRLEG